MSKRIAIATTTHRATATGRTITMFGDSAPEYRLAELPTVDGSLHDVAELPDGSHAYLEDGAGVTVLVRQMVARHYGGGQVCNTRTAPETLTGLIREARCGASDRHYLRSSGRDLVGFAA
jgi:hypothetical protein